MIPPQSLRVYTKTEKVNFLMNAYDTNKDGVLGFTEVKNLLVDLGYPNPANNDVYWFISLIDNNSDNKISWSELYNSLQ
jgi:Ca2+-binding EF-hand superfamily protein